MNDSSRNSSDGSSSIELPQTALATRPLRTWPVWILVPLIPLARFGPALLEDGRARFWMIAVFGPTLCCLLLILWWLIGSRATWKERLFGFLGLAAFLVITFNLVDPSMRGAGTNYFTMPMAMTAFGIAAIRLATRSPLHRTGGILGASAIAFCVSLFLRTEGMTGDYVFTANGDGHPAPSNN